MTTVYTSTGRAIVAAGIAAGAARQCTDTDVLLDLLHELDGPTIYEQMGGR